MLSIPLILLGSALLLVTIMIAVVFTIAMGLRRTLADIKVLIVFGIIGLLMIILGVLPWGIAVVVGITLLAVGGFTLLFFILPPSYKKEKFKGDVKLRNYVRREHIGSVLHFLKRIVIVIGVILLLNVIGLSFFLLSKGQWNLLSLIELLTILLLLEGSLIGAAGGFMFFGYGEYRIFGQAAINPAIASDQRQGWRKRRVSQQKWGMTMLIAGFLLILLGLLVSFLTSL